eukprot:CAMPEP_0184495952 /NCGR_PEP_ID=MMETSP0113_2-20130426/32762_1 /TAXON_ID=91329 /ORGANISM="Norrisiella sphaerica, Strain BC52" /LENGTH=455 /DNA_ID=CAMNT_0026882383 /DNA_START=410 /DNA_END=1780 /DNA_ORIENTATION=+
MRHVPNTGARFRGIGSVYARGSTSITTTTTTTTAAALTTTTATRSLLVPGFSQLPGLPNAFESNPMKSEGSRRSPLATRSSRLVLRAQAEGAAGEDDAAPTDPNIAANNEKKFKQLQVVDKIIELGLGEELERYLRQNLPLLDQDFWMTYMCRYDDAKGDQGKQLHLKQLADQVMIIVERLVAERRDDETLQRIALMDRLVEEFLQASKSNQLKQVVSSKIGMLTQDNNFWSRVAHRYEAAQGEDEKQIVAAMARNVQSICQDIAKQAGQTAEQAEASLQRVMAAGANEKGEWFLPLNDDEMQRMRKVVEEEDGGSDQLVSLALSWMKKASEASEQDVAMVVGVIQKVLHLISAVTLEMKQELKCPEDASIPEQLTHQLLQAREERWDELLGVLVKEKTVAGSELMMQTDDLLQKILFSMPAGSNKQRIMVEYVQELQTRIKKAYNLPGEVVTMG